MNKKIWVIGTAVLLIGAFFVGAVLYADKTKQQAAKLAQDHREALVRPHSPVYGSEAAKVAIVEFLDPACETCRAFYPIVKSLVDASFGQVKLVVRYAPFHQGSEQAVRILEAARMQNKYWQAMEATFASQPIWAPHDAPQPALIWDHIQTTGIDIAKAKADMNDPRTASILAQDVADLKLLGVTQTPGFFVNGKPLVEFGPNQLKALIDQEVRAAYGK
ncbi:disulfide bond formation protein DsbA [Variovorax sp. RO1]|uniref:DsbA family protein n=1 Tax=Variovorax sp. RO1 TaxID=2066034 RepID=UPI000C717E8E|nr:thioredoxin domain-containing protein [Variovorax sp. RO1]PLC05666.1 disulfide bond formation protein DsbA [Variovorax sp. RO1]